MQSISTHWRVSQHASLTISQPRTHSQKITSRVAGCMFIFAAESLRVLHSLCQPTHWRVFFQVVDLPAGHAPHDSTRQWVRHFTGPHAPHHPKSACGGRQVLQPGLESPACQPDSRTDDTLDCPNQNLLLLCPHRFCYTVMYLMKPPSSHECRPFPVHLQRQSRLARQHPRITCVQ